MSSHVKPKVAGLGDIFKYALGDGVVTIASNGVSNFGMVYMTQILGLKPLWAGAAMFAATLWDAVTDPVMGHISDNTRTRWGRRHPFVLLGGIATAVFFFLFWSFPQILTGQTAVFLAMLFITLLFRTATTVFVVPYTALGFELCPEYESRARLQGVRTFINQTCNFIFGAMAWVLFFQNQMNEAGQETDGSLIPSNYIHMGLALAVVVVLMASLCCFGSRRYAVDNRSMEMHGNNLRDFIADFISIFRDRLAVRVFCFFIIAMFAMMLMANMQMYIYIFYMKFAPHEKSLVHGGGMLASALAALSLARIVRRYDKKQAGYIGISLSMFGGLSLLAVFVGGLMTPQQHPFELFGKTFYVSTLVFGLLQMCWWGGCGILGPLAASMIADIAAINHAKTGELKNASYASIFSFSTKAAASLGIFLCGLLLQFAGIISGADEQTPEAIHNISVMAFLCGPIIMLLSILILRGYPINREIMENLQPPSG